MIEGVRECILKDNSEGTALKQTDFDICIYKVITTMFTDIDMTFDLGLLHTHSTY